MNRVQNILMKVWKYKAVECPEIKMGNASTCSFCFFLYVLHCIKQARCSKAGYVKKSVPGNRDKTQAGKFYPSVTWKKTSRLNGINIERVFFIPAVKSLERRSNYAKIIFPQPLLDPGVAALLNFCQISLIFYKIPY